MQIDEASKGQDMYGSFRARAGNLGDDGRQMLTLGGVARMAMRAVRDGANDDTVRYLADRVARQPSALARTLEMTFMGFGIAWANNAFPVVQPGARFAAALMSTVVHRGVDVRPPWNAFAIRVPDGALGGFARELFVGHSSNGAWVVSSIGDDVSMFPSASTEEFVELGERAADFDGEIPSDSKRLLILVRRLVVGTCLAMSDPTCIRRTNEHSKNRNAALSKRNAGEPRFLIYEIGRPVSVDCRPAVNDYLAGRKRTSPTVQWLVRGHWRNQACGPHLGERRLQWIEPHWKGAEDAPINVRPHVLGAP